MPSPDREPGGRWCLQGPRVEGVDRGYARGGWAPPACSLHSHEDAVPTSAAGSLWPVMFPRSLAFSSVQRSAPSEGAGDTGLTVTVTARLATSSKPAWSPTFSELRQRRSTDWEEGPRPGHTGPRSAALRRPPPPPPAVGRPTPVPPPCWCWGRMGSRRKGIPGGGSVGEGVHLHLHGSGPGHHPCSPVSSSWPCPSSLPIGWPRKHRRIEMGPHLSWLPSTLPLPISHHYPPLAWRLEGLTPGAPLECKPGLLGVTQMSLVLSSR